MSTKLLFGHSVERMHNTFGCCSLKHIHAIMMQGYDHANAAVLLELLNIRAGCVYVPGFTAEEIDCLLLQVACN